MKDKVIIFIKNLTQGKVKTRLAAGIGDVKALKIYTVLVHYTLTMLTPVEAEKICYFSENIDQDLPIIPKTYQIKKQQGTLLGERMAKAIAMELDNSTKKTILIGTDCPEINQTIILQAFKELDHHDVVIGPANDGGYYLIGLKSKQNSIFNGIVWSTNSVLQRTIENCKKANLSYYLLPMLSDLDDINDLKQFPELMEMIASD